jgi:hypothetical protein
MFGDKHILMDVGAFSYPRFFPDGSSDFSQISKEKPDIP